MRTATRLAPARLALLAMVLGLLAACGFHLQGQMPLPASLKVMYVDADDAQSEYVQALRRSLRASGVQLLPAATADATILRIARDGYSERVLTVSARNIPTDYELTYEADVSVRAAGRELMASERLSLSRVYSFDERRLLAKDRERDILVQALAQDMASMTLRRLAALQLTRPRPRLRPRPASSRRSCGCATWLGPKSPRCSSRRVWPCSACPTASPFPAATGARAKPAS